ncbi:MAG: peptidylprolyl isomerase, partial [Gammaproteobacteria bacterium]|nr:peptidylprolyl isomerase [Gammaproteobacteria bacterium]
VEPADEDLRRYFDAHAQRYVEPAELTLTHRFFSVDRRGDGRGNSAEADARAALKALIAGETVDDDSFHAAKTLTLGNAGRLAQIFGTGFRDAVVEHATQPSALGEWFGPVRSAYGFHLVRVRTFRRARQQSIDAVRERVVEDWRREYVDARESERYAEIRARYDVEVAPFASIGDLVQP